MGSESFVVEPGESEERLDRLAARRLNLSRSVIQRLVRDKSLLVDGEERNSAYKVHRGETVEARIPEEDLQPEDIFIPVVFEDEHLLVVNKPSGIVVHPGAANTSGTLVNALLRSGIAGGNDPSRPGVVHRLDRDTSGLMVLAKGEPTYSSLVEGLSKRDVRRIYRAVVSGVGLPPSGTVDAPVGRDPDNPTLMAAGVGKSAVTHFKTLSVSDEHTMLRVRLETGRTHQIRVHLSAIEYPVYSDPIYGQAMEGRRLWLHAEKLAFIHPVTSKEMEFYAPPPEDLRHSAVTLSFERQILEDQV
ncbi:RluA family pseudouridine synthase [soil metagenome]